MGLQGRIFKSAGMFQNDLNAISIGFELAPEGIAPDDVMTITKTLNVLRTIKWHLRCAEPILYRSQLQQSTDTLR